MKPLLTRGPTTDAGRTARVATLLLALSALAFTGAGILRGTHRPRELTFEECVRVAQSSPDAAVTNALRAHVSTAIEVLRKCGPNGAEQLRQIAEEAR